MKLSPLTVPYRVIERASSIVIVGAFIVGTGVQQFGGNPLIILIPIVIAVVGLIAYEIAYYQRFEYELTNDTLDIHSGVFSQRTRELPYQRIQNVDITRNIVQRVLGLAFVNLETAGGSTTEGSIRFVTVSEAQRIQQTIQRQKQSRGSPSDETEPAETELYAISTHELGLVGALSFDPRIIGIVVLVASGSVPLLSQYLSASAMIALTIGGLIGLIALVGASWVLGVVLAIVNYYGFRITRVEDDLQYDRGLLRRYTGSIPLSKVQTITVEDNPLKRVVGYATLSVETAGYAPGQGGEHGSQVAVPIARRSRIDALATEIESIATSEIDFERPPGRVRIRYTTRYLLAIGTVIAIAFAINRVLELMVPWYFLGVLAIGTPIAAHLKWKHRGYWVGPDHVVTRNGFWHRSVKIVPYYRVQTILDERSLLQRRWGIATIVIDTASSHSLFGTGAAAIDIDNTDATALRTTLTTQLETTLIDRRTSRSSFRWLSDESVESSEHT